MSALTFVDSTINPETLESMQRATARIYQRGEVTEELRRERALSIAARYGKSHNAIAETRDYKAAQITPTNYNWLGTDRSADAEQQMAMPTIRARARDLEQNNPYVERYLSEAEANVLGPQGMTLQMQIQEWDPDIEGEMDPKTGNPRKGGWVADEMANDKVESAWWEWRKVGNCDTSGELSFHEIERLMLRSALRDGHVLCRKVRNWDGNRFKFALQPIESDALDTSYNATLPNGNIVVMGVEMDAWRRRVAYHILTKHPGDYFTPTQPNAERRKRVDASEMIHLRFLRRIGQTVGVSALAPVMDQLEMLRGYEEAELISARAEACKGGTLYSDVVPEGGFSGTIPNPEGVRMKLSPGEVRSLPYGVKFQPHNPTHPNGNYSGYRAGVLRGIASGLSCSYNILANDLVGVSYSSLRGGLLDEREIYKMLQEWIKTRFHMEVFEDWLESSILAGEVNLPISKFDKFNVPFFQGRSWGWVDPKKDIEASALAIQHGFISRRQIVAESGGYILDVAKEQKADAELEKRYGLSWGEPEATQAAAPPPPDEPETDTDGNPIPGTEPDAE